MEYLELASDQLEDTVQFFEAQEDSIIKSRQMRSNQQHQVRAAIAQYATEQPQRSSAAKQVGEIDAEQYQTVQQNSSTQLSRLLAAGSAAQSQQQKRLLSTGGSSSVPTTSQ